LRPASDKYFFLQLPITAKVEIEDKVWFIKLEKTWLAIHPINLNSSTTEVKIQDKKAAQLYQDEKILKVTTTGNQYAGFALEVGEAKTTGSYENFKKAVKTKTQLDLSLIATGTVQLKGTTGDTLKITHNSKNELPILIRNGVQHNWFENFELYKSPEGNSPISLGWKTGKLRVEAGGSVFEETVSKDGKVSF
ncbi:MAG TPA: hypothetical protein VIQ31_08480, partial [Phormidium sp.]